MDTKTIKGLKTILLPVNAYNAGSFYVENNFEPFLPVWFSDKNGNKLNLGDVCIKDDARVEVLRKFIFNTSFPITHINADIITGKYELEKKATASKPLYCVAIAPYYERNDSNNLLAQAVDNIYKLLLKVLSS